jgi:hypothetical protein
VVGDNLYFYVSSRRGAPDYSDQNTDLLNAAYAGCSTGLAILRRDGFASMGSDLTSDEPSTLTTRNMQFSGAKLFVNADMDGGDLQVEVLDDSGRVITPFSKEKSVPIRSNKTLQVVSWKDANFSALAGKTVRFRFHVTNGRLFSFWVSNDETGSSNGYVAGGGPGFSTSRDDAGNASLSANQPPLADAGTEQTVRDVDGNGVQPALLDGSRSVDNDGLCRDFRWLMNGQQVASGIKAKVELPVGTQTIVLAVRDNDGAEGFAQTSVTILPQTDPVPSLKGLVMWLKADSLKSLTDGSPIAKWTDSSGNRMNSEQLDATRQPIYVEKGIGDAPAVRFDGVDDHLVVDECPGLLFTFHKSTIVAVVRSKWGDTIISQAHTNLSVAAGQGQRLSYGSSYATTGGTQEWPQIQSSAGGSLTVGRASVCAMVHSGDLAGETALFVNGHRNDNDTAFPYHRSSAIRPFIGCAYRQRSPWSGDIAEVLIYSRALPDKERKSLGQHLGSKYDIAN